ncbi:MAG TPA: prepilin-type N-terminal cleavage/methylation domain-containing protein [Propylenella sp.]
MSSRQARGFRPARRQAGFTLLEMLVAVAVLAVLVTLVPRSLVAARATLDSSQDWLRARLAVEAVLNDDLVERTLRPGVRTGIMDGRRWTATIERDTTVTADPSMDDRVLLAVRLEMEVSGTRTLAVETMRSGLPE